MVSDSDDILMDFTVELEELLQLRIQCLNYSQLHTSKVQSRYNYFHIILYKILLWSLIGVAFIQYEQVDIVISKNQALQI